MITNKLIISEDLDNKITNLLKDGWYVDDIIKELKTPFTRKIIYKRYSKLIKENVLNRRINLYSKIVKLYSKEKVFDSIIDNLNVSYKTIRRALKYFNIEQIDVAANGLRKRQYPINEGYFSSIDCPEKAYYLGLLYADGSVYSKKLKSSFDGMKISLTESDSYILNILNDNLMFSKPMSRYIYKNNKGRPAIHLSVGSKKIPEDLIKLGCFPNKSLTLEFPFFKFFRKEYMPFFLRGYFDGDGCIYTMKAKNIFVARITSSHGFCAGLKSFLYSIGISSTISNRGNFSEVRIVKRIDVVKFYIYIYNNNFSLCLERKRNKFIEAFKYFVERPRINKDKRDSVIAVNLIKDSILF